MTTKQTLSAGAKLLIRSLIFLKVTDFFSWLIFRQPVNDDLITVMIAYIAVIWLSPKLKPYRKDDNHDQSKNA